MRIRLRLFLAGGLVLGACGTVGAQEAGKTGLTIGYPGSVGVIWHATDDLAIRPDFSFNHSSNDTGDSWSLGTDIGVLFYLKKYDNVRTYVSPRFSYSRTSSTSKLTNGIVPPTTITGQSTGGAGLFGVQSTAGTHFSIFGEVGVAFSRRTTDSSLGTVTSLTSKGWGTTAGVGVIFYP